QKGSFIKPNTNIQEEELIKGVLPNRQGWGTEPASEMGLLHTEIDGEVVRKYVPSEQGNYNEYYIALYEAIRNNGPVPVTAEDGLKVITIIQADLESQEKSCKISL